MDLATNVETTTYLHHSITSMAMFHSCRKFQGRYSDKVASVLQRTDVALGLRGVCGAGDRGVPGGAAGERRRGHAGECAQPSVASACFVIGPLASLAATGVWETATAKIYSPIEQRVATLVCH